MLSLEVFAGSIMRLLLCLRLPALAERRIRIAIGECPSFIGQQLPAYGVAL